MNVQFRVPFELTGPERQSALWGRLEERFGERIAELRRQNDSFENDEKKTAHLRGQIATYLALMQLGKEPNNIQ